MGGRGIGGGRTIGNTGYPICGFGGGCCAVGGNTIGSGTPLATHKHSLENCGHELNPQLD